MCGGPGCGGGYNKNRFAPPVPPRQTPRLPRIPQPAPLTQNQTDQPLETENDNPPPSPRGYFITVPRKPTT